MKTSLNDRSLQVGVVAGSLSLAGAIFIVDMMTPLGFAIGVPYVAVVLLSLGCHRQNAPLKAAALGTVLTVVGFFVSPMGGEIWKVIANRILAVMAQWVTAVLCLRQKQHGMEQGRIEAERNAAERTATEIQQRSEELSATNGRLEAEIQERKTLERQRQDLQSELLDVARRAGMAETATGVLHNVGNVLNSVNVSANFLRDQMQQSAIRRVTDIAKLLEENEDELATFITKDEKGKRIPKYLSRLGEQLQQEHESMASELTLTKKNIDHIKTIISMQQSMAGMSGVTEETHLCDVLDDVLAFEKASLNKHSIEVGRDYQPTTTISVDRQRLLQILINLVKNAKEAIRDSGVGSGMLTISLKCEGDHQVIEITDTGVGIEENHLDKIFTHGFTTKSDGHGFGLHSCFNVADSMGGTLSVISDGLGMGATFILKLPPKPAKKSLGAMVQDLPTKRMIMS